MINFCGCCEGASKTPWCKKCREHVLRGMGHPSDATYYAQFGKPCPYQVSYDA